MPAKHRGTSTRWEILRVIKMQGPASIAEISRALEITPMAVRRHIAGFRTTGLVRLLTERRPKGRPAALCALTDQGDSLFPKAYDRFCADLIGGLASLDGARKVDRLFQQCREKARERFAGRMAGKGQESRVREAAAILSEEGYMAGYRKLPGGRFLITEHNCAIAHVARQYPQACRAEMCLLRDLLQARVERKEHLLKGDTACSYLVRFPARRGLARGKNRQQLVPRLPRSSRPSL